MSLGLMSPQCEPSFFCFTSKCAKDGLHLSGRAYVPLLWLVIDQGHERWSRTWLGSRTLPWTMHCESHAKLATSFGPHFIAATGQDLKKWKMPVTRERRLDIQDNRYPTRETFLFAFQKFFFWTPSFPALISHLPSSPFWF